MILKIISNRTIMERNYLNILSIYILLLIFAFIPYGCNQPLADGLSEKTYHSSGWGNDTNHGEMFTINPKNCMACHGDDMQGGQADISCLNCHHNEGWDDNPSHGEAFSTDSHQCKGCHGEGLNGGLVNYSCFICHHGEGSSNWENEHGSGYSIYPDRCKGCHGEDLNGGLSKISCKSCHHNDWSNDTEEHPVAFSQNPDSCTACHGEDLSGGSSNSSCFSCHHGNGNPNWNDEHGEEYPENQSRCKGCHGQDLNGGPADYTCFSSPCHNNFNICDSCHSGNGTSGSHPTHTVSNNRGPQTLDCTACHDENNHRFFADGNDFNSTTSCDNCHSPGGSYNGVNSDSGSIGAKNNWTDGVYNQNVLIAGKEAWCVGCHDDSPASSNADGSGPVAPNIAGDDTTFGYYINGHKNELCTDCHDLTYLHIDGSARTYVAPLDIDTPGDYYRVGYRLKSVDGQLPLIVPYRSKKSGVPVNSLRLCFSCHDSDPFIYSSNLENNFREDSTSANYHFYHLTSKHNPGVGVGCVDYCHKPNPGDLAKPWDSDFDGVGDSDMSCPACHNVHGSKAVAMVRSGELIGQEPGFNLKYLDNDSGNPWNFKDPQTVDGSTGGAFDIIEASTPIGTISDNGICIMCHPQRISYYRTP
ncbi:MAG: hypothetical protein SVZ03_03385 [Spirochaetota bacterium]|nr:hypothetical protein [Spirochaetota bacterium]